MTETTVTVTTTEGAPGHNATSQPTVKSDPGQGQNSLAWIRLNVAYFRTIPGILKLLQVVSCRGVWYSLFCQEDGRCRLLRNVSMYVRPHCSALHGHVCMWAVKTRL
jgi:hypothetical protein